MGCTYSTRRQKVERIRKSRVKANAQVERKEEQQKEVQFVEQAEVELMPNKVRDYRIPGGISLSPLPEFSLQQSKFKERRVMRINADGSVQQRNIASDKYA